VSDVAVRYNEAQRVAQETSGVDVNALFRKQAQWEQESGDKVDPPSTMPPALRRRDTVSQAAAARLWVALGEWNLAVSNMIAESMVEDLVRDVAREHACTIAYGTVFWFDNASVSIGEGSQEDPC
jgi:hypothetical protein